MYEEKGYSAKSLDNSCVFTACRERRTFLLGQAWSGDCVSEGYVTCLASKTHFGLLLPALLRWKFNGKMVILNRYAAALCMAERNVSVYQHILFFQL